MASIRADRVGQHRTAFDKNRIKVLASQNTCAICGKPVEKNVYKFPHPLSAVVDHIVPVSKGGHPSDLANLQLAHRYCNRLKSDKLFDIKAKLSQMTEIIENTDLPLSWDWMGGTYP